MVGGREISCPTILYNEYQDLNPRFIDGGRVLLPTLLLTHISNWIDPVVLKQQWEFEPGCLYEYLHPNEPKAPFGKLLFVLKTQFWESKSDSNNVA